MSAVDWTGLSELRTFCLSSYKSHNALDVDPHDEASEEAVQSTNLKSKQEQKRVYCILFSHSAISIVLIENKQFLKAIF